MGDRTDVISILAALCNYFSRCSHELFYPVEKATLKDLSRKVITPELPSISRRLGRAPAVNSWLVAPRICGRCVKGGEEIH